MTPSPPFKVSALLGKYWDPLDIGRLIFATGINDWRAVNLMSICFAESGGFDAAVRLNPGDNPSLDLGLWQINTRWHPEVSVKSAITAELAVVEAIRIANCGSWAGPFKWNQWMSWTTKEGQPGPARTVWLAPCRRHINTLRAEQEVPAL